VHDKQVSNLLKKSENKKKINIIFNDFNFDLVKIKPKEIIRLILINDNIREDFFSYLLERQRITINDRDVIIEYLCQTNFHSVELLEKLKTEEHFKEITERFLLPTNSNNNYFNINFSELTLILNNPYIIKQIELRSINEINENYSVSLNHLVNEIHAICFESDINRKEKKIKNYNSKNIISFLRSKPNLTNDIILRVQNLFDRRNSNLISHSVLKSSLVAVVDKDEYYYFKEAVEECLYYLLQPEKKKL
jgi:hypothetical protein